MKGRDDIIVDIIVVSAKSVMLADPPPLGRHELDVSDREQE